MKHWKIFVVLAMASICAAALAITTAFAALRAPPGTCGEYRYSQDGTCVDARNQKSGKNLADEILVKQWKP
jgi:hypothetical protein